MVGFDRYAAALELYDQWKAQGVKNRKELKARLKDMSLNDKLAELRRQIEMRTIGLGWAQFSTKWSFFADEKAHTMELLERMLVDDIIPHEVAMRRLKQLPKEAPPPQLTMRTIKVLGTCDADALRIEASSIFKTESLLPKARAARLAREAAGVSDSVEAIQPPEAPPFDQKLVGKHLEVCWPYSEKRVRWLRYGRRVEL